MRRGYGWLLPFLAFPPGISLNAEVLSASRSSFAILRQPLDARSAGMGRAFGAVASGAEALWWNPAGLGFGKFARISAAYQSSYENISLQEFAFNTAASGRGGFGLSIVNVSAGSFERRDDNGKLLDGSIRPSIYGLRLGYGKWMPAASLSLGLELGYLSQNLGVSSDTGVESSLGATWILKTLRVSTGLRGLSDAGAPESFGYESFLAAAWSPPILKNAMLVALECTLPGAGEFSYNLGLEYKAPLGVSLRSGYGTRTGQGLQSSANGLSLGLGLAWQKIRFDYAWTLNAALGDLHSLSVSYHFELTGPGPTAPIADEIGLEKARAYASQGNLRDAVMAYQDYIKAVPHSAIAWLEMGRLYREAGDEKNAELCFEKYRLIK